MEPKEQIEHVKREVRTLLANTTTHATGWHLNDARWRGVFLELRQRVEALAAMIEQDHSQGAQESAGDPRTSLIAEYQERLEVIEERFGKAIGSELEHYAAKIAKQVLRRVINHLLPVEIESHESTREQSSVGGTPKDIDTAYAAYQQSRSETP